MEENSDESIQSLDSIVQSLLQNTKGSNISPYLTAIQSLNGTKPGDKYKEINIIVKNIIENNQNITDAFKFIETTQDIPLTFKPLIRILVGKKYKSNEIIIEALKCEDKTIINQALKSDWFFDNSNLIIEADFFAKNILPHISVLTRGKIIKILSQSLLGAPEKAEKFFNLFIELYGFNAALPILPACSENFIFNEILKRKLVLSHNMLVTLFKIYPDLVLRYLNLGNNNNENNKAERQIHSINLGSYMNFLPYLIRHHIKDYFKLKASSQYFYSSRIGSTRKSLFLKQATTEIINNPIAFRNDWSLKKICKNLSLEHIEEMFKNVLLKNSNDFSLHDMLQWLEFYPKGKRMKLLTSTYRLKYSSELLENIDRIQSVDLHDAYEMISEEFFEKLFKRYLQLRNIKDVNVDDIIYSLSKYPEEKKLNFLMETFQARFGESLLASEKRTNSKALLKLLPPDVRIPYLQKLIQERKDKDSEYYELYSLMPIDICFPIFKEAIQESTCHEKRISFLQKLLLCCSRSGNPDYLRNFLNYYNTRHKNERIEVLEKLLNYMKCNVDFSKLNHSIWEEIQKMIVRAHTKGELSKVNFENVSLYIDKATDHGIKLLSNADDRIDDPDDSFLECFFDVIVDYIMETRCDGRINEIYNLKNQRFCLDKLVRTFSRKYPLDHTIWQRKGVMKKTSLVVGILEAFDNYEETMKEMEKNPDSTMICESFKISEYPWLLDLIKEIINQNRDRPMRGDTQIHKLLKKRDPELFKTLVKPKTTRVTPIINIKTGQAWIKLKKNQQDVLENWNDYYVECRNRLQRNSKSGAAAARRFLLTLKWCEGLPMKFVERSLTEIKEIGSMRILGILLEGEIFSKIATLFVPKESSIDVSLSDAKDYYKVIESITASMNLTNPPVSFDSIALFCKGDYVKVAVQAFTYMSKRVSKDGIMNFARNLANKPISVKKHGIKLFFEIADDNELREFLKNIWERDNHVTIRELLVNIVLTRFNNKCNDENWELVEICLNGLKYQDDITMNIFCQMKFIGNHYAPKYVTLLLKKIEELSKNELSDDARDKYLEYVFHNMKMATIKYLPEEMIIDLFDKYFFNTQSMRIFLAARVFGTNVMNLPFENNIWNQMA